MSIVVKNVDSLTIKVHHDTYTNKIEYVEFVELTNISKFIPSAIHSIDANSLRVSSISNVIFLTDSDTGVHYYMATTFFPITDFTWNVRTGRTYSSIYTIDDSDEVEKLPIPDLIERDRSECNHEYIEYYGIREAYRYCKKCDHKLPSAL